jgi:hypothetical protein
MTTRHLISAALLSLSSSAFAQDTTAPVWVIAPQNATYECDGTNGYVNDLNTWLQNGGNGIATDDSGAVNYVNDFSASVLSRLSGSSQQSAQDQFNALGNAPSFSAVVAAADYLADSCGEVNFPVNFWAVDAAGNMTYGGTASFIVQDTIAPTMNWTYNGNSVLDGGTYTTALSSLPVTVNVTAADVCGGTFLDTRWTWGGATTAPTVTYSNGNFSLTGGAAGTEIIFYAKATDECGNVSFEEFVIIKIELPTKGRGKLKGNEGLGNGVDPNTPGHDNNGGNDDPAFGPGNPGARYKNR